MKRGETVAIWKGARTQSVWEYTIDCAATKDSTRPCGGCFVFYLYYDLGSVVIRLRFAAPRQEPRDDIEKTARVGGGVMFMQQ